MPSVLRQPHIAPTFKVQLGAALILICVCARASSADHLDILIRAFIPKSHSSTRPIPFGGGDTMVEPPASSIVGCFETDQRSFSSDPAASSRLASLATVDLTSPPTLKQVHPIFSSNAIDCGNGKIINQAKTSNNNQAFSIVNASVGVITLKYTASGKNPNFEWAPAIDINGSFIIDTTQRTVRFQGKVDQYPAYEAYVRFNNAAWKPLFEEMPAYGKTALDLAFSKDMDKTASY